MDLVPLVDSWLLSLRADRKSPQTVKLYERGARAYLAWCESEELGPLERASLRLWVAELLDSGRAPATVRARQLAVRRFATWLADEGEIADDPFLGVKPPKLDETVTEPLSDDQLRAMLKACAVPKGAEPRVRMRHQRDEAILRLMIETGARAGEVVALQVDDLNLKDGAAVIRRGKGGKGRVIPLGPDTVMALDRYLRARAHHRLAHRSELWLGDRGKGFGYAGLYKALSARAASAGIRDFHPHLLRHTAAHRWLAAGGSEGGLMSVAGWSRPDMLVRYTKARASARAAEEARRLGLGDL